MLCVVISRDNDYPCVCSQKGNQPLQYITAHLSKIHGLDWSPRSQYHLVTASQDCFVRVSHHLSIHLAVCLCVWYSQDCFVRVSHHLSIHLAVCLCVWYSQDCFVRVSHHLSIHQSRYTSVHPSSCLSLCLV